MTQRKIFRFRGDVQNVGFRANAIDQARGLNVVGFVRNEPDGDVLMDVQGPPTAITELTRRIGETMSARIDETLVDEREPIDDRTNFVIRW